MTCSLFVSVLRTLFCITTFSGAVALAANKSAEIRIKGKLEAYIIDKHDGTHKDVVYIKEAATQRRYEILNVKMPHQGLLDAKSVVVKGKKKNAEQLEDAEIAFDGYTGTTSFGVAATPQSSGVQDVLVYLVNFQDQPDDKPWTLQQVNDVVFNQINSFYLENSANRTSIKGMVVGWYTLPVSSTTCNGFDIQGAAQSAAKAAGVAIENYDRHVFLFPQNSACGYSGMGQVSANPSSAWIHNSANVRVIGHELGHNLGAYHAHSVRCPGSPVPLSGLTCTNQDYGNSVDIMGYTGTVGHFNAFIKDRFGWLTSTDLVDASNGGTFTIAPYEFAVDQARALKVYRGIDAASGADQWFYLEYRQPIGFDSMIIDRGAIVPSNIFGGLTFVLASPSNGNSGYQLDMTPGSVFLDLGDAALLPGKVFTDPVSGISFATISAGSSGLTVKITKGAVSLPTPTPTPSPTPVSDTTKPIVVIQSPAANAVVSPRSSIAIQGTVSDNVKVAKVEVYVNGSLICTGSTTSYSCSYNLSAAKGATYKIEVRGYDSSNNISSAVISIFSSSSGRK